MKRRVDLIDQFADLVVGADDPRRLAERTLEVVMSLTNGRSGAVFGHDEGRIALFASRGIDQHVLDAANTVWATQRETLQSGQPFYVPDVNSERRLPKTDGTGPGQLRDGAGDGRRRPRPRCCTSTASIPHFCTSQDLERLSQVLAHHRQGRGRERGRTVERAPSRAEAWESYLERTPVEDMEREKLLLLLNRNEWNIARVARLMGVTRRTIYLRLQRYNIPRERVPKTRPRRATA